MPTVLVFVNDCSKKKRGVISSVYKHCVRISIVARIRVMPLSDNENRRYLVYLHVELLN